MKFLIIFLFICSLTFAQDSTFTKQDSVDLANTKILLTEYEKDTKERVAIYNEQIREIQKLQLAMATLRREIERLEKKR